MQRRGGHKDQVPNALTSESVIALLCAAADMHWLPAQHWPIDAALEELADAVPDDSEVGRALAQMPRSVGPGDRFPRVRSLMRELVSLGLLIPGGTGWGAGFSVSEAWVTASESLLASLSKKEQDILEHVGQRLCAMVTMASKKPVASGLTGSGTR
jgi:hypothetical protein